jgi:hypothetical protein
LCCITALNPNLTQTPKILKRTTASQAAARSRKIGCVHASHATDTQTVMDRINANANAGDAAGWDCGWVADHPRESFRIAR